MVLSAAGRCQPTSLLRSKRSVAVAAVAAVAAAAAAAVAVVAMLLHAITHHYSS